MDQPALLIFTVFVGIGIGFALFGLVSSLRGSPSENKRGDKPARTGEGIEILRLSRDPRSGKLMVDVNGKRFTSRNGMGTEEYEQLRQAYESLRSFFAGSEIPAAAPAPAAPQPLSASRPAVPVAPQSTSDRVRPAVSGLSIAAQIDEILQARLTEPEYAHLRERAIRLTEMEGKGLVVMVGLQMYEGVGDVPDAEIQELIRSCVQKWEAG
ncbi:MAG: hypothetical protein GX495_13505 [Chloroflexi bacterium]|jgi:hypothetical protein|nr:hypothetical protein [Chloroflexota bacterium]